VILLDVNALVYAFHRDSVFHVPWRGWLDEARGGPEPLALCDVAVVGLVRVSTNRAAFDDPATAAEALSFVAELRLEPTVRSVHATQSTWRVLGELAAGDAQLRANLVPDAYLAALAVSHGCRLVSADRGMRRFVGLGCFDPTE